MSDTSYESTLAACDKIAQALDLAVNNDELAAAQTLADGLGPMLPDDTESLGIAGDLVGAIQEAQAAMARAKEQAELLKTTVEKNHGAANEAALATGHMAEREFHTTG